MYILNCHCFIVIKRMRPIERGVVVKLAGVQETMSVDLENINISGLQSGVSAGQGESCLYCPWSLHQVMGFCCRHKFQNRCKEVDVQES